MSATNITELFTNYIDEIYWHGYAENLAQTDRPAYEFELTQFKYLYNLKP